MSSDDRITTLDGLTTAATSVDDKHNLRSNEYRLVSSDGVLFTVSSTTLRHMTVLWDIHAANSQVLVLSDEDFKHAKSVRLLLGFLLHGALGHPRCPVDDIADAIDLAQKYGCRSGYELCIAHLGLVTRDMTNTVAAEVLILASQLNEIRLAKMVVGVLAEKRKDNPFWDPPLEDWKASWVAQLPALYVWALSAALEPRIEHKSVYFSDGYSAERRFEEIVNRKVPPMPPRRLSCAERRAQQSWGAK